MYHHQIVAKKIVRNVRFRSIFALICGLTFSARQTFYGWSAQNERAGRNPGVNSLSRLFKVDLGMYRHDLAKGSNHLIICTPAIFLELLLSQSPFKECDKKTVQVIFFLKKKERLSQERTSCFSFATLFYQLFVMFNASFKIAFSWGARSTGGESPLTPGAKIGEPRQMQPVIFQRCLRVSTIELYKISIYITTSPDR